MPTSTNELQALAEEFCKSDEECKVRISLHKSYYCAYHACLQSLGPDDGTTNFLGGSGGSHQQLRDYFYNHIDRSIAIMLDGLKKERHVADYKLSEALPQSRAVVSFELLKRLLKKLKQ